MKSTCAGEILVGAWGGPDGKEWCFKSQRAIKGIIIRYGQVIDSIIFKGDDGDEEPSDGYYSTAFGGGGGDRTEKICIDFPSELVTGISGTHGRWENWGKFAHLITSLKIQTNRTEYGPFGEGSGHPFSFSSEGGMITGFHGRAGSYLDAIGVFIKPVCSLYKTVAMKQQHSDMIVRSPGRLARSPGPWGSVDCGRDWDDGVFSAVKEVCVYVRSDISVISDVQFLYQKKDGAKVWSAAHVSDGPDTDVKIEKFGIDWDDDSFLIGIEGFYGQVDGVDVIKSITLSTNKGKYGPVGDEIGKYFNSMASDGKIVGFFGNSGAYLNAIGVHIEYEDQNF